MNEKTTTFQLYRYQLLPIDRYLQTDMLTGIKSVAELLERKNEFFAEAIRDTKSFSDNSRETITKKLYEDENFFLFRIAVNKSMHRETKEFKDELIDNWPSILVGIWNDPDVQIIAIQKRTSAFKNAETMVKMIIRSLSKRLSNHHLRAIEEPLFEKKKFWSVIAKNKGKIKAVDFEIITPNMANISKSLPEDLRKFAKGTNTSKSRLKIESDPEAPLHLEETDDTLQGLVDYSSKGGGNISLRIEGMKRKIHISDTVKEIQVKEAELQGDSKDVVEVLKEMIG